MDHQRRSRLHDRSRPAARRRWSIAAAVITTLVCGSMATGRSAAIVPPPTTAPQRSTTTLPTRPTTTTVPTRPTTTTAIAGVTTTDPPTTPSTAGATTVPPPTTVAQPTATAAQPISEPPTTPPTSEPEVASYVMSNPIVVDPDVPASNGPIIVDASVWCVPNVIGAQFEITVQNIDAYHYPPPLPATYVWTLGDNSGPPFTLSAWESASIHLSTSDVGSQTFTVTDEWLDVSTTVDIVTPDCSNAPAPSSDPLPPIVKVTAVSCWEGLGDGGGGQFSFHVTNVPGDDGTTRPYEWWVSDGITTLTSGAIDSLADGASAGLVVPIAKGGSVVLVVRDHVEPALQVTVEVEIPPCAPPAEDGPIPAAPEIVWTVVSCVEGYGAAEFVVLNANYPVLGGPGEVEYTWTLANADTVVETYTGWFYDGGVHTFFKEPLKQGDYVATISVAGSPELGNSATLTVPDCFEPQPASMPITVLNMYSVCQPGHSTETIVLRLKHKLPDDGFSWTLKGNGPNAASDNQYTFADGKPTLLAIADVPAGAYDFTISSHSMPDVTATVGVDIGECGDSPSDAADPADPDDPDDTTSPADPADPAQPSTTEPAPPMETLPATALSGVLPETR